MDFNVDSWVYVKLRPYRQITLIGEKYHKLSKCFYGPFQILDKVGPIAYRLALPPSSRIHKVFHCSMLKLNKGSPPQQLDTLPPLYSTITMLFHQCSLWIPSLLLLIIYQDVRFLCNGMGCHRRILHGRSRKNYKNYLTLRTRSFSMRVVLLCLQQLG